MGAFEKTSLPTSFKIHNNKDSSQAPGKVRRYFMFFTINKVSYAICTGLTNRYDTIEHISDYKTGQNDLFIVKLVTYETADDSCKK